MSSMKKFKYLSLIAAAVLATSCSDILDEQPRTFFEPGFFQTQAGVEGGITALYSSLRNFYGQAYYYNSNTTGTDEATWGQQADGNFKDADLSGVGSLNSSSSRSDVLWGGAFTYINTASGIIENAEAAGLPASLIAEAKFFRAYYYFQLVQTFGGVPLDLGSGKLKFNSTPVRVSKRNTVPEVYQAIHQDLTEAIENLPDNPRLTGGVTKTVARLVLAKSYLTFGWWLENPNNIDTYPACSRTDLDGHDKNWYFQQSLDLCKYAIANPAGYGLCETFRDVNLASNDRNKEILLWADHTEKSEQYNGGSLSYGGGGAPDNFAGWMLNWNHGTINLDGVAAVAREASQNVGRPWTRMAPTHEAIQVFVESDITKDSRFDGTFTTAYYGTWNKNGSDKASLTGADGTQIPLYGKVLEFVPTVVAGIDYSVKGAGVGAGKVAGHSEYVIDLNGINRIAYPALWKLGCDRTDYNRLTEVGSPNAGSTRPYDILKFSDFYLTAAEAAFKLNNNTEARNQLLVLRKRAGVWTYRNNDRVNLESVPYVADFSADLEAATPAVIDLDYILDERMREFYGEGFRWFDLARTQTWESRAGSYTISVTLGEDGAVENAAWGDHTPKTFTRTIEKYMYLRPIPQGQINGMEMSKEEKAAYQNPGYAVE